MEQPDDVGSVQLGGDDGDSGGRDGLDRGPSGGGLADLRGAGRRETRERIDAEVASLHARVVEVLARQPGDPWAQPANSMEAYDAGDTVTHDDRTWTSTLDGNVWQPGVAGWREAVEDGGVPLWTQPAGALDAWHLGEIVTDGEHEYRSLVDWNVWPLDTPGVWELVEDEPEAPEEVPEWVRPTGAHEAKKKGERFRFEGAVYESTIDGNVWSPSEYPQGWRLVD